jgi:hypothetical protein
VKVYAFNSLIIILALTALLICGCSSSNPPEDDSQHKNEVELNGITFTLIVDEVDYGFLERIYITMRIRNESGADIAYNPTVPPLYAVIDADGFDGEVWVADKGDKYLQAATPTSVSNAGSLANGGTINLVTYWDQRFLDEHGNEMVAPTGDYLVKALFVPLPDYTPALSIAISHTSEITTAQEEDSYALTVTSFHPGTFEDNLTPSLAVDGQKALGAPDDDNVKLGLDGWIIVDFGDDPVVNGPGHDIRINTFPAASELMELDNEAEVWINTSSDIFVRMPTIIGRGGKTYDLDLSWSGVSTIKALKIIDLTAHSIIDEGYGADGFSVESVVTRWSE